MPIAIHTKYIGPTNTRGARIGAKCDLARKWAVTIPYDYYAEDCQVRHAQAARALLAKYAPYSAEGPLYCCGNTLDNKGYVFCINPQATNAK